MTNFIQKVTAKTQQRLTELTPLTAAEIRTPHNFLDIFTTPMPRIIAEIKFASPARGEFAIVKDPLEVANQYLANGACALSVLTEPYFFKGSVNYLRQIRAAFPAARLLMKDFILDERQLDQAKVYGADAVLLIVAFLKPPQLRNLYNKALALGMTPLVEVHTVNELITAKALGAQLIGINNRNLHTLQINLATSKQLAALTNPETFLISESGLQYGNDIKQLQALGYQGFLIGSHFMATAQPGRVLQKLRQEVDDAS